jgi:hypothetical protein
MKQERAPKFKDRIACSRESGPTTSCMFGPYCGMRLLPRGHDNECSMDHDQICVGGQRRFGFADMRTNT